MVENPNVERRPRGRPPVRSDEATLRLIVDAAAQEFRAHGFARTCVDAVARRAGVSSRTLYRLVPTKAELFAQVISDHISQFVVAIDDEALEGLALDAALERILIAYGSLTLGQLAIALSQLVIAECGRFPELASTFYEKAILRAGHALEHWLRRQQELGHIAVEDPGLASGMLRGMMTMEPQRAAMLGQRPDPEPEEIEQRARICARLFLDGCRPRPRPLN
jgi:AcrR family transcriptional regulator